MIGVDEALARVGGAVERLPDEVVDVAAALGRVLAVRALAVHELPLCDQSAMDGYAVCHDDIATVPVELVVSETIAAVGHATLPDLTPGTAARIFTGGVMPSGADTVVRQEATRATGTTVVIQASVHRGTDVRHRGEELEANAVIAEAGTPVTPGLSGALVHAGVRDVTVTRRPRVRVFVTGDEVVDAGGPLSIGQVPDSNGPLIAATLRQWGVDVVEVARIADTREATEAALDVAMGDADLVITTGGVSVGDFDFVPAAAAAIGCGQVLWKVAQRPGGPLFVARRGPTLLVGLPGNPAAVHVNLHVYVRMIIDRLMGGDPECRWRTGRAVAEMSTNPHKVLWTRVIANTDDTGVVRLRSLARQGSHMLSNLASANAIARVPPGDSPVPIGMPLPWIPLDS